MSDWQILLTHCALRFANCENKSRTAYSPDMRTLPRALPALVTPFNRSGTLDTKAHGANVGRMWDLGMRGILVAGSTGEGPYLEPGERYVLSAEARASAPRSFVLCGIQAETVRSAVMEMNEAARGDADAVLVVTPTTLVRHRPDLIEAYFTEVIDAAPLPVLLYSVPKVTGVELAEESVASLASRDEVVGMKDSGGDPLRAGRLVAGAPEGFSLFAGATAAVSLSIASGAFGAITASANYAPRLVRDTVSAAQRSTRTAAALQHRLTGASAAIERFGIPAVKYAASRVGFAPGKSRSPLGVATPEEKQAVRRALRAAELV
jgi:dihydrodipicolinate synthase/N-acetylneuraminate lyase